LAFEHIEPVEPVGQFLDQFLCPMNTRAKERSVTKIVKVSVNAMIGVELK